MEILVNSKKEVDALINAGALDIPKVCERGFPILISFSGIRYDSWDTPENDILYQDTNYFLKLLRTLPSIVPLQIVEDKEEVVEKTVEDESDWTDSHYNHNYYFTPEEKEQGFVRLDVYKVAKVWKIGSKDDSGALWHTFKIFPRFGEKNTKEREIKAMYAQIKALAEIQGVEL